MKSCARWRLTVAVLLWCTAAAKLVGVVAGAPLLKETEALSGLRLHEVVVILAAVEVGLGIYAWRAKDTLSVAAAVLLFAGIAIAYRLMVVSPQGAACPCLGGVSHWFRGLQEREGAVLGLIATWLALSSLGVLAGCRVARR